MIVSKASDHDLPVAKELLDDVRNIRVFSDTAFIDTEWQDFMRTEQYVKIITSIKRKKGQQKLVLQL